MNETWLEDSRSGKTPSAASRAQSGRWRIRLIHRQQRAVSRRTKCIGAFVVGSTVSQRSTKRKRKMRCMPLKTAPAPSPPAPRGSAQRHFAAGRIRLSPLSHTRPCCRCPLASSTRCPCRSLPQPVMKRPAVIPSSGTWGLGSRRETKRDGGRRFDI